MVLQAEKPWNYASELWHKKSGRAKPNFEFWNKSKKSLVYVSFFKGASVVGLFGNAPLDQRFTGYLGSKAQGGELITGMDMLQDIKYGTANVGQWVPHGNAVQAYYKLTPKEKKAGIKLGMVLATATGQNRLKHGKGKGIHEKPSFLKGKPFWQREGPAYFGFLPKDKNIYLSYRGGDDLDNRRVIGPQTGPLKGLKKRTESFLSFDGKKIKSDEIQSIAQWPIVDFYEGVDIPS